MNINYDTWESKHDPLIIINDQQKDRIWMVACEFIGSELTICECKKKQQPWKKKLDDEQFELLEESDNLFKLKIEIKDNALNFIQDKQYSIPFKRYGGITAGGKPNSSWAMSNLNEEEKHMNI